jgi:hypothetical protein
MDDATSPTSSLKRRSLITTPVGRFDRAAVPTWSPEPFKYPTVGNPVSSHAPWPVFVTRMMSVKPPMWGIPWATLTLTSDTAQPGDADELEAAEAGDAVAIDVNAERTSTTELRISAASHQDLS